MNSLSRTTTAVRIHFALALGAALLVILAVAIPASASRSQQTMIQDDRRLIHSGPEARTATLDEFDALGVEIVKIRIDWRSLAPSADSDTKPEGFDGANPSAYGDKWGPYDDAISGAGGRGMRVMVLLGGRAPDWASKGGDGIRRPNAREFGAFVRAVGTRYGGGGGEGAYSDPNADVDIWAVWNEGNLSSWLMPQWKGKRPVSPRIYRRLYLAAHEALGATGNGGDEITFGELAPSAGRKDRPKKVRPLRFLREFACLNKRYRPFRGKKAKRRGCRGFDPIPGAGLAYHPYTLAGGPGVRDRHRDDASIGQLSRVSRELSRIARRGRFTNRRPLIYITEFGFQSRPPDRFASPMKKVPRFMSEAEYIAFRNSRVATYGQYPLWDDPGRTGGFQSGLRFSDGRVKPKVYRAFELPFYARRRSASRVEMFGAVRAGSPGDEVVIQRKVGKGKWRRLTTATLGTQGYFRKTVRTSASRSRKFRVRSGDMRSHSTRAKR